MDSDQLALYVEAMDPYEVAALADNDAFLVDISRYKILIEWGGFPINAKRGRGNTLLQQSIRKHQYDASEYLLSKGADPNVIDEYSGRNALNWLCYNMAVDKIDPSLCSDLFYRLIEAGTDPTQRDIINSYSGIEYLRIYLPEDHPMIVDYLAYTERYLREHPLQEGMDVQNLEMMSPEQLIDDIFKMRADVSDRGDRIVDFFAVGVDPNYYGRPTAKYDNDVTLLDHIIEYCVMKPGDFAQIVRAMVDAGLDGKILEASGCLKTSPIEYCVRWVSSYPNLRESIELLAEAGFDLDGLPGSRMTPLGLAVAMKDMETSILLLSMGADPGLPFKRTEGPSHRISDEMLKIGLKYP